ncbi:MAG: hypothetical protein ACLPJH_20075 [Myxococcaceae bacterium]
MGRSVSEELDLLGLGAGRVFLPGEAAAAGDVPLQLRLLPSEVRALVHGARLLGVCVSRLVSWAGSVNPDEAALPRWQRPFVQDNQLVRLCLMLDPGALRVSTVLAQRFEIEVETYLAARSFDWLRRIRARHPEDRRWERLAVPAARIGWRVDADNTSGLRLA